MEPEQKETQKRSSWPSAEGWDKKAEEYVNGIHIIIKETEEKGGKFWIFIVPKEKYENTHQKCLSKTNKSIITLDQALLDVENQNCKNRAGVKEILSRIVENQAMKTN